MEKNSLSIYNEDGLRSKIHTIRGIQVMLDFDLAKVQKFHLEHRTREQYKIHHLRIYRTRYLYADDCASATIYTAHFSDNLKLDLQKHKTQYQPIDIKVFKDSHDRFLIIDDDVYHIGASLKDLGKKMFAFSKMEISKDIILSIL